jgi:hypothetical protein
MLDANALDCVCASIDALVAYNDTLCPVRTPSVRPTSACRPEEISAVVVAISVCNRDMDFSELVVQFKVEINPLFIAVTRSR